VTHPVDFETGLRPILIGGIESNVAAFVLFAEITTPAPIARRAQYYLTLTIDPPVGRAQRATLLVSKRLDFIPARPAAGPALTTATLDFPIRMILPRNAIAPRPDRRRREPAGGPMAAGTIRMVRP